MKTNYGRYRIISLLAYSVDRYTSYVKDRTGGQLTGSHDNEYRSLPDLAP